MNKNIASQSQRIAVGRNAGPMESFGTAAVSGVMPKQMDEIQAGLHSYRYSRRKEQEEQLNQTEQEVWNTIQKMNKCWTCGDPSELEKLSDYFHEKMVAITATDKYRLEGKEACFNAWKGFAENAEIHSWKAKDQKIQVYRNAAVVTYYFDMSFDMDGQSMHLDGRDMFTLIKENDKWLIVADQFSQYPQSQL